MPAVYRDSAFLDSVHCYNPGLKTDIIRGELFTAGYGFIIDYLMEALRNLRGLDYSNAFEPFLNYPIAWQPVTKKEFTRPSLLQYEK